MHHCIVKYIKVKNFIIIYTISDETTQFDDHDIAMETSIGKDFPEESVLKFKFIANLQRITLASEKSINCVIKYRYN